MVELIGVLNVAKLVCFHKRYFAGSCQAEPRLKLVVMFKIVFFLQYN